MNAIQESETTNSSWTAKQAYTLCAICIVAGFVFGYFLRGSASGTAKVAAATDRPPAITATASAQTAAEMPSLDDMKRMADKSAEPLLTKLKASPKDPKLLAEIGNTYKSTHQFDAAASYFAQALAITPKDMTLRYQTGAAKYYAGDVDGAIATLQDGLQYSPNDASTLFDLGAMKIQKKGDPQGAVELWERLLKTNPNLPAEKKAQVQKMIAEAKSGNRAPVN